MASLTITNTFTTGTKILAAETNTNFTDISTYINNRNAGSTDWDFVSSAGLITAKALIRANDGTAAATGFGFISDVGLGGFRSGSNTYALATNGISRFSLNTSALTLTLPILGPDGSLSDPTYSYSTDSTSGHRLIGNNSVDIVTNSIARMNWGNAGTSTAFPVFFADGDINNPSRTWGSDTDTGEFWESSGTYSLVSNTVRALRIDGNASIQVNDGSLSVPGIRWINNEDKGFFAPASGSLAVSLDSAKAVEWTSAGTADATLYQPQQLFGGAGSTATGLNRFTNTAIVSSAKQIMGTDVANFVLVHGSDAGGGDAFLDIVLAGFLSGNTPTVVSSHTLNGTPAVRTYTVPSNGVLSVSLASGTYTTNTQSIGLNAR